MKKLPRLEQLISLTGKHALITGSAAGIGKAIAFRLAEAGANISLVDINDDYLTQAKNEFVDLGVKVNTYVADMSDKVAIDGLWRALDGNEPDILVNNAGIYPGKPFIDVDETFYQHVMHTNLDSAFWMCQHMIAKRANLGGIIINIGSIEAVLPFKADLAHYSVSKAGVVALTRALAKEHARHGFRINAILPGGIMTPGTKAVAKQLLRFNFDLIKTGLEFRQRLPAKRMGQPDDVARIALVLASDLASYMHGTAVPVDGGFLSA